MEENKNKTTIV